MKTKFTGMKARKLIASILTHLFLAVMCLVWLIPFVWLIAHS